MKMTGHKTGSVYRRYAMVSEGDLREAGLKLAASGAYGCWGRRRSRVRTDVTLTGAEVAKVGGATRPLRP